MYNHENILNYLKGTYIIESLIFTIPLYLFIGEVKKFNKNIENLESLIKDIKTNIEDISKSNLKKYPFIKDIQTLTKKINKILL